MKYCFLVLFALGGCADLNERAGHTLDGLKSFYFAMCMVPPSGKEKACEDGKNAVNAIGEFYNEVNQ